MADATTRQAPGESSGTVDDAKQQAQEKLGEAREQAQQAAGQARERARTMVDERSTQAGERVSEQASDIRSVAEELRGKGKEGPAKVAEQAADRAERVGGYLTGNDADRILADVERVARKNPWAVIAGGIAVGFAASRFLKASGRERYRSSMHPDGRAQLPPTSGSVPPVDTAGVGSPYAPPGSR